MRTIIRYQTVRGGENEVERQSEEMCVYIAMSLLCKRNRMRESRSKLNISRSTTFLFEKQRTRDFGNLMQLIRADKSGEQRFMKKKTIQNKHFCCHRSIDYELLNAFRLTIYFVRSTKWYVMSYTNKEHQKKCLLSKIRENLSIYKHTKDHTQITIG